MPAKPPSPTPDRRATRADAPDRRQPAGESPAVRWVKDLFRSKVGFERRGKELHVVLKAPPPAPPAEDDDPKPRRSETLRKSQDELRALLDRHADTRHVVPHLSFVEQLLATGGMRALGKLPLPVLHKSLKQLDALMHDEPGAGLAELRRRLAAVIAVRLGDRPGAPVALAAAAVAETEMEVTEASHSQFDALERSWTGTMPGELGAALAAQRSTGA